MVRLLRRAAIAAGVSLLSVAILSTSAVLLAAELAKRTNSGLFGICGPYGDDWSITAQLVLFGIAFLAAPFVGLLVLIRTYRAAP